MVDAQKQEKPVKYSPTLSPTYEQWKSLAFYLTQHETSLQQRYGAMKIVPPTRWNPILKNPYEIRRIKTYWKQEIIRSTHQSNVFYIKKSELKKRRLVCYDHFKSLAESDTYRLKDDMNANMIDHFWATLTTTIPVSAKDIDGSLFDKRENVFNMTQLPSMLKYYPRTISGITYPTLNLGTWANAVGLHIDDHDLPSFHYHHSGASRIWFIVNPSSYAKLEELVNELKLFSDFPLSCLSPLQHKSLLLDPTFFYNYSIEFSVIEQKMNELVVVYPGVYHFYFDTGFNLIESIKYALPSSLTFHRMSPRLCSCTDLSSTATLNRRFFTDEIVRRFEREHLSSTLPACLDLVTDDENPKTKKSVAIPQIETVSVSVQTDNISMDLSNDVVSEWFPSMEDGFISDQHASCVDELWSSLEGTPSPMEAGTLSPSCLQNASPVLSYTPPLSEPPKRFIEIYQHLLDSKPNQLSTWRKLKKRKCYHCRQKGHLNRQCPYALTR